MTTSLYTPRAPLRQSIASPFPHAIAAHSAAAIAASRSAPAPLPVLRLAITRPPGASAQLMSSQTSMRVSSGKTRLFSSNTSTTIPANRRPSANARRTS